MEIKELYQLFTKHPSVSTDTRNILPGSLFFALKGQNFNGNTFAFNAIKAGAAFAVVDEPEYCFSENCILVKDVLSTLQQLAHHHRKQLMIPFLAITGSNGKTTTKELVRNVLTKKYRTSATKGNLNNHIGIPLTILAIPFDCEFAVIEMGANHQGEIDSYCKIVEPDFGLITNVGKAHLEGFGGFEGVKKGKGELYRSLSQNGAVFINSGNYHLAEMAKSADVKTEINYGTENENYCSGNLISDSGGLKVEWKCGDKKGVVNSSLIGAYNFENILSAICIGNYFGVSSDDLNTAIEEYVSDNSRSQILCRGSNTIILDAYNANPTSMAAALNNFYKIDSKNKIVFLGEMAELGTESDDEHHGIINILKKNNLKKIILVGNNFEKYKNELEFIHFSNSDLAADYFKNNEFENAYILIKGSRSTKMEKIIGN